DEELGRHGEAEHPGSRGIDDQFELARLHNRQVRRLGPLENAAGIDTGLTPRILNVGTVAHQPAHFGNFTRRICRGNRVARRQVGKLHPPTGEKHVGDTEERGGPLAHKRCESRINLVAGAGVKDLDLQSNGARSRFHVSQHPIRIGGGRIDEYCYTSPGTSSCKSSSCFATNSPVTILMSVALPPGRARLATSPSLTGSSLTTKTMGIVEVVALAANAGAGPPGTAITETRRRAQSAASAGSLSI